MRCEACGYQFLLASSTKCPDCGDVREAIVADGYDFLTANSPSNALTNVECQPKRPFEHDPAVVTVTDEMIKAGKETPPAALASPMALAVVYRAMAAVAPQPQPIEWTKDLATGVMTPVPIMDSVVGGFEANAHLTRRVAELEADKSRRGIVAQNIAPTAGLPTLGIETWREIAMAFEFEIEDLTRQLAAQALAHAEQMEGLKEDREKARRENVAIGDLYATATVRASKLETEVTNWQDAWAKERDFWRAQMQYQLSAIRVTPTTQPTDAQQTTGDVKVAKEPKAFPAGALKAGGSDPRRMGP